MPIKTRPLFQQVPSLSAMSSVKDAVSCRLQGANKGNSRTRTGALGYSMVYLWKDYIRGYYLFRPQYCEGITPGKDLSHSSYMHSGAFALQVVISSRTSVGLLPTGLGGKPLNPPRGFGRFEVAGRHRSGASPVFPYRMPCSVHIYTRQTTGLRGSGAKAQGRSRGVVCKWLEN